MQIFKKFNENYANFLKNPIKIMQILNRNYTNFQKSN